MADVASTLAAWSTTAASNLPTGATPISSNLDDNLRQIQAVVRTLASANTIASATTTDLSTINETFVTVSGTNPITGLGTVSAGIYKWLTFSGILTLTHNGTSLILPGGANITTAANDSCLVKSLGSGNWQCIAYMKASGLPVVSSGDASTNTSVSVDGEMALFSGTGGKTLKRATTTGLLKAASGVLSAASSGAGNDYVAPGAATSSGLTMNTAKLLGRTTASSGAIEEIAVSGATLSSGTLTIVSGASAASQAQMEAASDNTVMATPANVKWHPGVAKAWISCDSAGSIEGSWNVTSITDDGAGLVTVTINIDMSGTNYPILASAISDTSTRFVQIMNSGKGAGAFQAKCMTGAGTASDPSLWSIACFGDQ